VKKEGTDARDESDVTIYLVNRLALALPFIVIVACRSALAQRLSAAGYQIHFAAKHNAEVNTRRGH